ncbi:MAG: MBL fold metallo-hydrolase [Clostridia bacterium]|nr:MBL fold metallo-hydrolase [Clostridia bacterium]
MKILFLGTGAADFPKEKCKRFRRTASALIDDIILIDPGPWVLDAIEEYDVDVKKIKYVLATHHHDDHFNQATLDHLTRNGARFIELAPRETVILDDYTILGLPANHTVPCTHFVIEKGAKRMFYGLDGAWLTYEAVDAIWKKGVDLAVFDGTIGFVEGDWRVFEHNSLNMIIEMKKSLKSSVKHYVISHLAYTLHPAHEIVAKEMEKHDITVAYDGLSIEF